MRRGFTLVEIMIVVIIVGLLAAIAIPAFSKARQSSIIKTVQAGNYDKLTPDQKEMYRGWVRDGAVDRWRAQVGATQPKVEAERDTKITDLDGHQYYLIPKSKAKEATINGESYWLVPVSP